MIVKIFANKGGGSAGASIDYLLGKDRKRDGAKILSGDPELSKSIAESLEFKNKYTVGCLSFEEKEIDPKAKKEIMEKFEKTIFAGMEKDQYNITWIEHSDKDRVELNFFIPNVELTTQKRLQPYYDKSDRFLTDSFQTVINKDYGLSDPHDPSKKQLLKIDLDTPKSIAELKKDVHELILDRVAKNEIKSQENIVEIFNKAGLEVTRTTGKSISIKNPDGGRNIRFDGELYGKEFYEKTRTIEELREYVGREQSGKLEEDRGNDQRNYERVCEELGQAVAKRSEKHHKLYPEQSRISSNIHDNNISNVRDLELSISTDKQSARSIGRFEDSPSELQRIREIYTAERPRNNDGRREQPIHNKSIEESQRLQERALHSSAETLRIGAFLHELSRRAKEAVQRARERITEATERFRAINDYQAKSEERERETIEMQQGVIDRKSRFVEFASGLQDISRSIKNGQHKIDTASRTFDEVSNSIKHCYEQTERTNRGFAETVEAVDKAVIRQEQKQSRGWSMSR